MTLWWLDKSRIIYSIIENIARSAIFSMRYPEEKTMRVGGKNLAPLRVVLGYYPLGRRGRRERLSIAQCGRERSNWPWFLISTKQASHWRVSFYSTRAKTRLAKSQKSVFVNETSPRMGVFIQRLWQSNLQYLPNSLLREKYTSQKRFPNFAKKRSPLFEALVDFFVLGEIPYKGILLEGTKRFNSENTKFIDKCNKNWRFSKKKR